MQYLAHVEVSKGSRQKYEYDKENNKLVLDRLLHNSMHYPYNYGYIDNTLADDGDALDVMILTPECLQPNSWVMIRPIGHLVMEDEKGVDEKVIGVIANDVGTDKYQDIADLDDHVKDEIENFFKNYKNMEKNKWSKVGEWKPMRATQQLLHTCQENYNV